MVLVLVEIDGVYGNMCRCLLQDSTVRSSVDQLNGADRVERYSPPPGTFPRKLSGSRQQAGTQSQASHGVFIPARDEASNNGYDNDHLTGPVLHTCWYIQGQW